LPIARYFAVVGCLLTALLLIAGWALPEAPASVFDRPENVERAPIRIASEHKWPEKIELDTSQLIVSLSQNEDEPVESRSDGMADEATLDTTAKPDTAARPIDVRRQPVQFRRKKRGTQLSHMAKFRVRREKRNSATGDQCCRSEWAHRPASKRVAHRDPGIGWYFREEN